jgi:predicted enzyme involved in methoxymalonyl-ACP biosynthesis
MMSSGAHAPPAKPEGKAAWMAAKASWREYESKRAAAPGECDVRVGIAASFTPNNLAQFAGARLLVAGFKPEVIPGPYNQLFQVCLDPRSHFGERCDVIALLWRMEDLMGDDCLAFLNGDAGAVARAVDKAVALASAVSGLRSAFQGTILVGVPPFPACLPAGPLALDNPGSLGEFHRVVVGKFLQKLETVEGARALDMDAVQRQVGYAAAFDTRQWYLYRQPWTDAYLYELGDLIARMIRATRRSSKKCVVLDCDNTLWGGVIGEDGLDGIQIGD